MGPLAAPLDAELRRELKELGEGAGSWPTNPLHGHVSMGEYRPGFPEARLVAAPGLPERRKDLAFDIVLGDQPETDWAADLDQTTLDGLPEVLFHHRPSRALISGDAFWNVDGAPRRSRLWAGRRRGVGPTFAHRRGFKDKAAARRRSTGVAWDPVRLVWARRAAVVGRAPDGRGGVRVPSVRRENGVMDPYAVLGARLARASASWRAPTGGWPSAGTPTRRRAAGAGRMAEINAGLRAGAAWTGAAGAGKSTTTAPPARPPRGWLARCPCAARSGGAARRAASRTRTVALVAVAETWASPQTLLVVTDRRLLWLLDDAVTGRVRALRFGAIAAIEQRLRWPLRGRGAARARQERAPPRLRRAAARHRGADRPPRPNRDGALTALRTVTATRYVTPLREGGSMPGARRGRRRRAVRR